MKLIIAGSRTVTAKQFYGAICKSLLLQNEDITEIISGEADGVDSFGALWGYIHNIPVVPFPADWENIDGIDFMYIKPRKDGTFYNVKAGFDRNEQMAEYADALLLIWDGNSHGSLDMLKRAKKHKLTIEEILV